MKIPVRKTEQSALWCNWSINQSIDRSSECWTVYTYFPKKWAQLFHCTFPVSFQLDQSAGLQSSPTLSISSVKSSPSNSCAANPDTSIDTPKKMTIAAPTPPPSPKPVASVARLNRASDQQLHVGLRGTQLERLKLTSSATGRVHSLTPTLII